MREKARKKRARIDARAHTRARAVRAWKKFFFPFPIYVFHILIYSLTLTNLRQAALRFPIAPNANHPSPPPNRMFLREFVKKKFVNLQNCFDLFNPRIHVLTVLLPTPLDFRVATRRVIFTSNRTNRIPILSRDRESASLPKYERMQIVLYIRMYYTSLCNE